MLVLTRKANQQIQIGDHVVLTILQVKGNTVRVGIEAPRDVRVIRGELRGLEPNRPAPETMVTEETAAAATQRTVSLSSSRRQSPVENVSRQEFTLPMLPGMAAAAVADFTPIRSSRRLSIGSQRGLALPRR